MAMITPEYRDELRVRLVLAAYRSAVRHITGLHTSGRVNEGTRTYSSALSFWNTCAAVGRSLTDVMVEAVTSYSSAWCRRTFRRPYPPFNLTVCEKSRNRLFGNLREKRRGTVGDVRREADAVGKLLMETMSAGEAIEVVRGGWPENDKVRKIVEEELCRLTSTHGK